MRTLVLGAATLCGAACIPNEPYWWVQDARLLGLRTSVVEPGGYSTQVNVPEGQRRASALPLDTVELEWFVAVAPDVAVQEPLWLACTTWGCFEQLPFYGPLPDCPLPLPLFDFLPCRLGEGNRLRVGLAGAYTLPPAELVAAGVVPGVVLLAIGSRSPEVSPETCLERYSARPYTGLEQCLIGQDRIRIGPAWAILPFSPDLVEIPPGLLAQDADTHPDILGFRVTRERGADRIELSAAPGDTVRVEAGEHITVLPLFIGGGEQEYFHLIDPDGDGPEPPTVESGLEMLVMDAQITAIVDQFEAPEYMPYEREVRWVVPEDPEPAILYVDARDRRDGFSVAALRFDPEAP